MVAIIDYDAGNIKSVEKALISLGADTVLTRDPEVILSAEHIILPGVGAFGDAMEKLHHYGLVEVIREAVKRNIPFLGNLSQGQPYETSNTNIKTSSLYTFFYNHFIS